MLLGFQDLALVFEDLALDFLLPLEPHQDDAGTHSPPFQIISWPSIMFIDMESDWALTPVVVARYAARMVVEYFILVVCVWVMVVEGRSCE